MKHWHQVSPVFSADYEPDDAHGHVDPAHHPVEREQRVVDDAEVAVITWKKASNLLERFIETTFF